MTNPSRQKQIKQAAERGARFAVEYFEASPLKISKAAFENMISNQFGPCWGMTDEQRRAFIEGAMASGAILGFREVRLEDYHGEWEWKHLPDPVLTLPSSTGTKLAGDFWSATEVSYTL